MVRAPRSENAPAGTAAAVAASAAVAAKLLLLQVGSSLSLVKLLLLSLLLLVDPSLSLVKLLLLLLTLSLLDDPMLRGRDANAVLVRTRR